MASRDLSHTADIALDRRGPALTIRGAYCGYTVDCDDQIVASAPTFLEACEALHRLRAIRAFAKEELFHVLAKGTA